MKRKQTRKQPRVGDVVQITLPDGRFAYGRIYRDASVGFYRQLSKEPERAPIGDRDFLFNVGVYDDVLSSRHCAVVGRDPFESSEEEWPPPNYIQDVISGGFSIYYKGETRKSSKQECKGLEQAAVWGYDDIVERLLREGKRTRSA